MKNLETKKLSRNEMKSVLGGSIVFRCSSDLSCQKGYYCDKPEGSGDSVGGTCVKKETENAARVAILK